METPFEPPWMENCRSDLNGGKDPFEVQGVPARKRLWQASRSFGGKMLATGNMVILRRLYAFITGRNITAAGTAMPRRLNHLFEACLEKIAGIIKEKGFSEKVYYHMRYLCDMLSLTF